MEASHACTDIHHEGRNRMNGTKKLLMIVRDDKRLLGMFSGIIIDIAAIVAIVIVACVWYLP